MADEEYFDKFGNAVGTYGKAAGLALETGSDYLNWYHTSTWGVQANLLNSKSLSLLSSTSYVTLSAASYVGKALGPIGMAFDVVGRANSIAGSANSGREAFAQAGDFVASAIVGTGIGLLPVPGARFVAVGAAVLVDKSDIGRNAAYAYDAAKFVDGEAAKLHNQVDDYVIWKGTPPSFRNQFGPKCFPAGTSITLANGETVAIEDIRVSTDVASFDGSAFRGRGGLTSKRVMRLFTNITDTWVVLSNGMEVTPGHHFLDAKGGFRTIEDILATDGQIVLEDGSVAHVTGEYVRYSEETAHLYEQAEGYVAASNSSSLALAPVYKKGWKTYNFEVEDFHTYVAGGVRVHNDSYFEKGQITGPGPLVTPASGKQVAAGTIVSTGSQYLYRINADGSTTAIAKEVNHQAVLLSNGPSHGVGTRRYDASTNEWNVVEAGGAATQITGSGPVVPLASGTQINAGTKVYSTNGNVSVVNANGSVTSVNPVTGAVNTYGNGQRQYDADTNGWETIEAPTSSGHSSADYTQQEVTRYNADTGDFYTTTAYVSNSDSSDDDSSSGEESGKPILLDLDGDGLEINPLSSSSFFYDMNGDGLKNRTAWAGVGDGVCWCAMRAMTMGAALRPITAIM